MAYVGGSFALTGNCFYLGSTAERVPTSIGMFGIAINPVEMFTVGGRSDLYDFDVNGRVVKVDVTRAYPRSLTIDFYLSSLDIVALNKLWTWHTLGTKLWGIDGMGFPDNSGQIFRYYYEDKTLDSSKDTFGLCASGEKSNTNQLPFIPAWSVYVAELKGDFFSGRKMNGNGSVTLAVNGVQVYSTINASKIPEWYWLGDGS